MRLISLARLCVGLMCLGLAGCAHRTPPPVLCGCLPPAPEPTVEAPPHTG